MSDDDDSLSFGDDFDDLLELANRPPRSTQAVTATAIITDNSKQTTGNTTANSNNVNNNTNGTANINTSGQANLGGNILEQQLNEAKGEAGVLRDKISRINNEREHERKRVNDQIQKINEDHLQEQENLKQTIQRLQDEKRFLTMSAKTASSAASTSAAVNSTINNNNNNLASNSPVTPTSVNSTRIRNMANSINNRNRVQQQQQQQHQKTINNNALASSPILKRRKVSNDASLAIKKANQNIVALNLNNIITDEVSLLFDSIMSHKSAGTDITTMEILNKLKLVNTNDVDLRDDYQIWNQESIGKSLFNLLSSTKKDLPLDKCIATLQEKIATLIKNVCFNEMESNIAVPFLLEMMYRIITFRPSAVRQDVLKNTFIFLCDLIRVEEHTLMESKLPDDRNFKSIDQLQPQIFQFELINNLVIFNSFDLLEISIKTLQSHNISREEFKTFFDPNLMNLLKSIYKLALPISYKINFRAVINIIETLKTVASIQENLLPVEDYTTTETTKTVDQSQSHLLESSWWHECTFRINSILDKEIKNIDVSDSSDLKFSLNFNPYHDNFGLIRNIGNDLIGKIIPKLINPDIIQGVPSVISKDDINILINQFEIDYQFEYWNFILKNEILDLFDSLLTIYPEDLQIANSEMLSCLTKVLSTEQEILLERNIGQDSPNIIHRQEIIEHLMSTIFKVWTQNRKNIETERVKDFENELFIALWRIVATDNEASSVNPKRNVLELNDHAILVDSFHQITLNDQIDYYEDAFDGELSDFMKDEIEAGLHDRTSKIMQIKYNETSIWMARHILESEIGSSVSMENVDSLYKAMGL